MSKSYLLRVASALNAEPVLLHHRFVVKTTDQQGQKVFINICSSDKVPMAGSWANGKVHCCFAACVKFLRSLFGCSL